MYDVEMMQMLTLVHAENQMIFEIVRSGLLFGKAHEEITFKPYEDAYKDIMKSLEKYSPCPNCSYKNRFEKMKEIVRDKEKTDESSVSLE